MKISEKFVGWLKRKLVTRKSFVVAIMILAMCLVLAVCFGPSIQESAIRKTEGIGDGIIIALKAYARDHQGYYPGSLEALVPAYLPEIKQPRWGDSGWIYVGSPGTLKVGYETDSGGYFPFIYYDPERGGWFRDM
jgi:hypothetical protein